MPTPLRVLIAPDKFKNSLTATEAAEAMRDGWLEARPHDLCHCLPISDGGEGLLDVFAFSTSGKRKLARVPDPLGRVVPAAWFFAESGTEPLAVLESSQACGLHLLSPAERNPLVAMTWGVGHLLLAAREQAAKQILVGLGGSGTNDGGTGMAQALGFEFLDAYGQPLTGLPASLRDLAAIRPPRQALRLPPVVAATDVRSPLTGPQGATRLYGPQKGLLEKGMEILEAGLETLARRVREDLGCDAASRLGSGAAGGLGFGLLAFCNAEIRPGFDVVAEVLALEQHLLASDLVLTGEGSLDAQSLEGKAPVALARLCNRLGRPIIALPGRVVGSEGFDGLFRSVLPLANAKVEPAQAIAQARQLLRQRSREAARATPPKNP
jgi:glycerate kinase